MYILYCDIQYITDVDSRYLLHNLWISSDLQTSSFVCYVLSISNIVTTSTSSLCRLNLLRMASMCSYAENDCCRFSALSFWCFSVISFKVFYAPKMPPKFGSCLSPIWTDVVWSYCTFIEVGSEGNDGWHRRLALKSLAIQPMFWVSWLIYMPELYFGLVSSVEQYTDAFLY